MILVLILLGIFILSTIFTFLILSSTLHIEIKNLNLSNMEPKNKSEFDVIFSFYLGNYIKWFWIHLNNDKMKKYYSKIQLEKLDLNIIKNTFEFNDLKQLKKSKPQFSYLDFEFQLGLESPITTSLLVSNIASIISIISPYVVKLKNKKNYNYKIIPIYQNKTLYKINLNCIIEIKLVHIINKYIL